MAAHDLPQRPAIRGFQALLDSLDQPRPTTWSIAGSAVRGIIPITHRCTPLRRLMACNLLVTLLTNPVGHEVRRRNSDHW
jgi:hypothetical protein